MGRTNRVHAQTEPEGAPAQAGAWCTASASHDATYRDYDIDVRSDQPHQTVTASNGASHSWYGHPLYLFSHEQPNGTGAPTGNGNGLNAFGGTFSLVVNP